MDKKKILVVDDEPDVTAIVAYHLKAKGYQVECLNDATASIAKARSLQPDLIILDIMMPLLSGIQLCRILRADNKLSKVPIIFLTAKANRLAQKSSYSGLNQSCAASRHPRNPPPRNSRLVILPSIVKFTK